MPLTDYRSYLGITNHETIRHYTSNLQTPSEACSDLLFVIVIHISTREGLLFWLTWATLTLGCPKVSELPSTQAVQLQTPDL